MLHVGVPKLMLPASSLMTALTHNPQPMHLDHEVAAASEFGKPLVNSVFTFGLMVGVSVADTTFGTLVANLGYDKLVFPNPVFAGDTLRSAANDRSFGVPVSGLSGGTSRAGA